jgi:site-specific DNA-methyltransferase (adenine-specific)/site-specific DNA-methyltransferase (cytosine-N4-specific)
MGSGTTLFVAQRMKRNSIGIEIVPEYYKMVESKLKTKLKPLPIKAKDEKTKSKGRIAVR